MIATSISRHACQQPYRWSTVESSRRPFSEATRGEKWKYLHCKRRKRYIFCCFVFFMFFIIWLLFLFIYRLEHLNKVVIVWLLKYSERLLHFLFPTLFPLSGQAHGCHHHSSLSSSPVTRSYLSDSMCRRCLARLWSCSRSNMFATFGPRCQRQVHFLPDWESVFLIDFHPATFARWRCADRWEISFTQSMSQQRLRSVMEKRRGIVYFLCVISTSKRLLDDIKQGWHLWLANCDKVTHDLW